MSELYKDYELNEPGEAADWSTRENTLFKAIIDTLPDNSETLVTSEHVHTKLVSPDELTDPVVLTDNNGRFIVGTGLVAADTLLHVWAASAGAVAAPADAAATIESDDDVSLSLLVPNAKTSRIVFGTLADNDRYSIEADYTTDLFGMYRDGSRYAIVDHAGNLTGTANSMALLSDGTLVFYVNANAFIAGGKSLRPETGHNLKLKNFGGDGFEVDDASGALEMDANNHIQNGFVSTYGTAAIHGTLPMKDSGGTTKYMLFSNTAAA